MLCSFFAVKNLPIRDSLARAFFLIYAVDITQKKHCKEETRMRHVYIRGILALVWLAAAIISGGAGNMANTALYIIMCGLFAFSAYSMWKKEKN